MQHDRADLTAVSAWMRCDVEDLGIELVDEPMSQFDKQVQEMLASYPVHPREEARTMKVLRLLKEGGAPRPIYIERDDPYNFILEGRHRIVAFYLLGMHFQVGN